MGFWKRYTNRCSKWENIVKDAEEAITNSRNKVWKYHYGVNEKQDEIQYQEEEYYIRVEKRLSWIKYHSGFHVSGMGKKDFKNIFCRGGEGGDCFMTFEEYDPFAAGVEEE